MDGRTPIEGESPPAARPPAPPPTASTKQPWTFASRIAALVASREIRDAIGVHGFQGVVYFHKESFEALVATLRDTLAIDALASTRTTTDVGAKALEATLERIDQDARAVCALAAADGYRFFDFEARLTGQTRAVSAPITPTTPRDPRAGI